MKACPECSTRYEDHVEVCLADGETLVPVASTPAPVGAAPAAPAEGGTSPLVYILPVLLLLLLGGGAAVFFSGGGGTKVPEPSPEPALPKPPVAADPPPVAPEPTPAVIPVLALVSSPAGAVVMENDMEVCTTPCNIEHPAEASFPRTFELTLDRHKPATLVVEDLGGPYLVELKARRRQGGTRPAQQPASQPTAPNPTPKPNPAAPTLGRER